ncbi:hypothetical protein SLS60_004327 [Paraconiothyrium brasiliense]|uniref:Cytochrome P450 n=1 Tax=Paraconiothyrium brasiliense TaxID=300254 RepID=A0ABR3RK73_9PLEO
MFPNGQGNVEKFLQGRVNSAKWEQRYGPIYRLWSGTSSEVVLTKAAHVEAVFRDSHRHIKAHANDSGELMNQLLGSCLGLISGKLWETLKPTVEPPFLHSNTKQYVDEVQKFTKNHIKRLALEKTTFRGEQRLHPVRDLKMLPFLFVARTIYGELRQEEQEELLNMVPHREKVFASVISGGITRFWFSKFFPFPAWRALHDFKARWTAWNDRVHGRAVQSHLSTSQSPIIGMYDSVARGQGTREQLLQTLDEMLFANLDVTMGGLSWPLVFLATHPEVQDKLRTEIFAHSDAKSRNTYLLASEKNSPTLLAACLLEAARLRPLAAFSVPQSAPTSRVLDGYEIPAGTKYVIDAYALNIRDPFWGEDRDKFIPQRWLERLKSGRDLRYRYWRFGFGPRKCLGKYVSELILRAVLVELLESWQISYDGPKQQKGENGEEMDWPWDNETWIHHPDLWLKCNPLCNKAIEP